MTKVDRRVRVRVRVDNLPSCLFFSLPSFLPSYLSFYLPSVLFCPLLLVYIVHTYSSSFALSHSYSHYLHSPLSPPSLTYSNSLAHSLTHALIHRTHTHSHSLTHLHLHTYTYSLTQGLALEIQESYTTGPSEQELLSGDIWLRAWHLFDWARGTYLTERVALIWQETHCYFKATLVASLISSL